MQFTLGFLYQCISTHISYISHCYTGIDKQNLIIYYVQYYRFGFLFYNLRLTSYIINCSFTVSALLEIHFIVSLKVAWMNFILFFGQFDADWKIFMHRSVATVYTLSKMSSPNKPLLYLYYNFCRHMKLGFASFRNFF